MSIRTFQNAALSFSLLLVVALLIPLLQSHRAIGDEPATKRPFGPDPFGDSKSESDSGTLNGPVDPFVAPQRANQKSADAKKEDVKKTRGRRDSGPASQNPFADPEPRVQKRPAAGTCIAAIWATANPMEIVELEKVLAQPGEMNFLDEPLANVVQILLEKYKLPISIDVRALDDLGITADIPVTARKTDMSLGDAIHEALATLDLTYTISNTSLVITTHEADQEHYQLLRTYWDGDRGFQTSDGTTAVIYSLINPDVWECQGGKSVIRAIISKDESQAAMAVRTNYQTHRKIHAFLQSVASATNLPMTGAAEEAQPRR